MKIRKTTNEIKRKYNYVYKLTLKSNPAIFYIGKRSTDKVNEELKAYSEWIDLPEISSVTPKNVTNHCEFWVVSETIASKLFK